MCNIMTDSKILSTKEETVLVDTIFSRFDISAATAIVSFDLLFRGSEHEFSARSFHEQCRNDKCPTISIIQTTQNYVFGCCANLPFKEHLKCYSTDIAFLYLLRSSSLSNEIKIFPMVKGERRAIKHISGRGPTYGQTVVSNATWGTGYNLSVFDKCNQNDLSYCYGTTKDKGTYKFDAQSFCGGHEKSKKVYHFQVVEYPIYDVNISY